MAGLRMEACANDHNISSNATWARDRSNCREVSPDQAYGFGCLIQRAYVTPYTPHKLPNDPTEARQNIKGPNAWWRERPITQGHHFIQRIFHPRVSFFLRERGIVMSIGTAKSLVINDGLTKSKVENTTLPFFCVTLMNSVGSSSSTSIFFSWKTKPTSWYTKASGSPWASDNSRPSW